MPPWIPGITSFLRKRSRQKSFVWQNALDTVQKELEAIWTTLPQGCACRAGRISGCACHDTGRLDDCERAIQYYRTRRYNAEWALLTQIEELSARFDNIEDPYLRERKADIEQVAERIMKVLTGTQIDFTPIMTEPDGERIDMIVVAYDISPADMLQFRDDTFSGFVSEIGGRNSHAAIVARSIDTPAVFGLAGALSLIRQDDWLIVDADAGIVIVNPDVCRP